MQVLVLNSDYSYLNTVGKERALSYVKQNKVVVEKYSDLTIKKYGDKFNIVEEPVPAVVRFVKFIRKMYQKRIYWTKKNVHIRDNHTCQYCGCKRDLTVDHIMPKSRGGDPDTFENTVCACFKCNNEKGDRTPREAGMRLHCVPKQPTIMEFIHMCNRSAVELVKEYWESL